MVLNGILIAGIIAFDQWIKFLTVTKLKPIETFPIIENTLHLTYVENTGAAFSILEGRIGFFVIITLIVVGVMLFGLCKYGKESRLLRVSLIFIIGGAIGNLIDRVTLGYVVDMIDFRLINYAVFNIADCFVVVGTGLLAIYIIFFDKLLDKSKKEQPKPQERQG